MKNREKEKERESEFLVRSELARGEELRRQKTTLGTYTQQETKEKLESMNPHSFIAPFIRSLCFFGVLCFASVDFENHCSYAV